MHFTFLAGIISFLYGNLDPNVCFMFSLLLPGSLLANGLFTNGDSLKTYGSADTNANTNPNANPNANPNPNPNPNANCKITKRNDHAQWGLT